jgi:integrase
MRTAVARLAPFIETHAPDPEAVDATATLAALGDDAAAPGLYYLIDDDTQAIIEPAWLYFHAHFARTGIATADNPEPSFARNRKQAYHLAEWFDFIDKLSRRDWRKVDHDTILSYATFQVSRVSRTSGKMRDESTIGAKIGSIYSFYAYTNNIGLTQVVWDSTSIKARFKKIGKGDPGDRQIRPFDIDDVARIRTKLGSKPTEKAPGDFSPTRDRLMFEIGVMTGMRGEEICFLRTKQFKHLIPDPHRPRATQPVRIKITKGRRHRTVNFPNALITEIKHYIGGERKLALASRLKEKDKDHGFLLVNLGTSSRPGAPLKTNTIHRNFTALMRSLNMATDEERIIGKERRIVAVPGHSFHDTRHSFAVRYYVGLKREVALNPAALQYAEPWELVQHALGHADWHTTQAHYLSHVPGFEAQISDRQAAWLGDIL